MAERGTPTACESRPLSPVSLLTLILVVYNNIFFYHLLSVRADRMAVARRRLSASTNIINRHRLNDFENFRRRIQVFGVSSCTCVDLSGHEKSHSARVVVEECHLLSRR
jgi:hypothetical protein